MTLNCILVITIVIFLAYDSSAQCPPENLARPCKCKTENGLTLQCLNITDNSVLEGVFRRIGNTQFKTFQTVHTTQPLPAFLLVIKQFHHLDVVKSNVNSLFETIVSPSNIIDTVTLHMDNFVERFPWKDFHNLKHLTFLLAYRVDIIRIDDDFHRYVNKGLRRLDFWETNTNYIDDGIFTDYEDLIDIRIQVSKIYQLKRSYFRRPANIQVLFFDDNKIESLPDDIFGDMPHLRSVGLSKNQLKTVSEAVFGVVYRHLADLSLSGNPIICDCNIKWIIPLQGHRYLDGDCVDPESLRERALVTLRENDFSFCIK